MLPTSGIDNLPVQVGPDSWEVFVTSNQWIGPWTGRPPRAYTVWAGKTGEAARAPGVPAVWVDLTTLGADLCSTSRTTVGQFVDRNAGGPLRIMAVNLPNVDLESQSGRHLVFSLTSDTFSG